MTTSFIELSRSALKNNIEFIRQQIGENVILSSVIKGNAYGHGIHEMTTELERLGIRHFSVFGVHEARQIFEVRKKKSTIMVMGEVGQQDFDWVVRNEIECYVFNFQHLKRFCETARKLGKKAQIHIELETGMHRTGFDSKYWKNVVDFIHENKDFLVFKGLCTHFAGAESISNYKRIQRQRRVFRQGVQYFKRHDLEPEVIHTSCSAAMISYPKERWDLVRIGILQYGLWPSRETYISYLTKKKIYEDPLKRVISWKSHIMDIKSVKRKEFIGYGMTFLAEQDTRIASVPVGYSQGYSRVLSNQGKVIVNGKRLDVIGTVNMNMLLIDVTSLERVSIGDTVLLIGDQGEYSITVAAFSDMSNQLNYELLTRLDKDIPRKIIA